MKLWAQQLERGWGDGKGGLTWGRKNRGAGKGGSQVGPRGGRGHRGRGTGAWTRWIPAEAGEQGQKCSVQAEPGRPGGFLEVGHHFGQGEGLEESEEGSGGQGAGCASGASRQGVGRGEHPWLTPEAARRAGKCQEGSHPQSALATAVTHPSGFLRISNVSTPRDEVHLFQANSMDLLTDCLMARSGPRHAELTTPAFPRKRACAASITP